MRAGGMSVWQFLRPGVTVALLLGVFAVTVYNPLAAAARSESERLVAEAFGKEAGLMVVGRAGLMAAPGRGRRPVRDVRAAPRPTRACPLTGVTVIQFDTKGQFVERIDADKATLGDSVLGAATSPRLPARPGGRALRDLHGQHLPHPRARRRRPRARRSRSPSGSCRTSFNSLKRRDFPPSRYKMQYALLLSRPMLLIAMVILAATVSLRSFRSGGIQTMVLVGMVGGIGFFLLTEVSRQIGMAGLISPTMAVWAPIGLALLVSLTVLLHQEDG